MVHHKHGYAAKQQGVYNRLTAGCGAGWLYAEYRTAFECYELTKRLAACIIVASLW